VRAIAFRAAVLIAVVAIAVLLVLWLTRIPSPVFAVSGDERIAEHESGAPVLILERELCYAHDNHRGWCWRYMLVRDGKIDWCCESELRKPSNLLATRHKLQAMKIDKDEMQMNYSSPDVHKHSVWDIHVGDVGSWSFPIVDGKVTIPVEKAE